MAAKKLQRVVEWVGGMFTMPAYVNDKGERYRPEVLIWLSADRGVLGQASARRSEIVGLASDSLQRAIERPLVGQAHAPQRVRVASPELAEALRAGHPGLEVSVAPTPEVDAVAAAMREHMSDDDDELSYLSPGVDSEQIAALFRAAAALFRAQPWKVVPDDQSLISITIEALEVNDAALSVIGQMGQSLGFIVFSGADDFERFLDAADAAQHGERATMPPHFSLNFQRDDELSAALRKEVADHQWEVAGAAACPWPMVIDADLVTRPPTSGEVAIMETIARALPELLPDKQALLAAWHGGAPVARTVTVHAHEGDVEVRMRVPYAPELATTELLAKLAELAEEDEIDRRARGPLEATLLHRFSASPEAKGVTDVQACHFVMNFAADYFTDTIATLGAYDLEEIVFEILPRKMTIDASEAAWIIDTNRAFYAFLKRELGLPQADACLRVLGPGAVKKLEAALSDRGASGSRSH